MLFFSSQVVAGQFCGLAVRAEDHGGVAGCGDGGELGRDEGGDGRHLLLPSFQPKLGFSESLI